jgi:hypothetical protein
VAAHLNVNVERIVVLVGFDSQLIGQKLVRLNGELVATFLANFSNDNDAKVKRILKAVILKD